MPARQLGFSALLKAVYTRIDTHANTSSYNVYNYVPDNATLPYIRIGDPIGIRSTSFNNRDFPNEDNTVTIHIFSKYLGDKEVSEMLDNVIQAIDSSSLSITGYSTPFLAVLEMADAFMDTSDPNEVVRHGVCRFRFSIGAA